MKLKLLLLLISGMLLNTVHGDNRHYVWTYEYQTLPQGEAELESYTEYTITDTDTARLAAVTLQYEYEIGMNDRFDVGIYQKFNQSPGSSLVYDGYKIRLRYRPGEKGRWFLDPLIYLEYKNNAALSQSALETKLIMAKDYRRFNLALNPTLEFAFEEDRTAVEFEYSAGVSYRLHPLVALGLEAKGDMENFYWGPTLSHGKNDLWFALGWLLPGSGDNRTDSKLRFIIGVGL